MHIYGKDSAGIDRVVLMDTSGRLETAETFLQDNSEVVLLASAARTATVNSADITNLSGDAIVLVVDVTAITASPVLTLKLQLKDSISGKYVDIWTVAANLTAVGTTTYLFGLGGTGSAGDYTEAVNLRVPRTFRLRVAHADTDSATYSASAVLLV